MALEVFSGTSITLPDLRGDDQHSHSSVLVDNTRNDARGTFSTVNIGGSGANIPKVGIIFPTGVPVFCG